MSGMGRMGTLHGWQSFGDNVAVGILLSYLSEALLDVVISPISKLWQKGWVEGECRSEWHSTSASFIKFRCPVTPQLERS